MAWIAVLFLLAALIVGVSSGDRGTLGELDGGTLAAALASLALLTIFVGRLAGSTRGRIGRAAKDLGIWGALALALVVGYSLRGEFHGLWQRLAGELLPPGRVLSVGGTQGERAVRVRRRLDGHFTVRAELNGAAAQLLVDTGASTVMLRPTDAAAAGIDVARLSFTVPVQTANGQGFAAAVRLKSLAIGTIALDDVDALVARPGTLSESLLGMNFLRRLRSYEFSGEFLTLRG